MRELETLQNRIKKKILHVENSWIENKKIQVELLNTNAPRFEINSIDKKLAAIKAELRKNHNAFNLISNANTSKLNTKIRIGDRILFQGRNLSRIVFITKDEKDEYPEFGIISQKDPLARFILSTRYGQYISIEEGHQEVQYKVLPI